MNIDELLRTAAVATVGAVVFTRMLKAVWNTMPVWVLYVSSYVSTYSAAFLAGLAQGQDTGDALVAALMALPLGLLPTGLHEQLKRGILYLSPGTGAADVVVGVSKKAKRS